MVKEEVLAAARDPLPNEFPHGAFVVLSALECLVLAVTGLYNKEGVCVWRRRAEAGHCDPRRRRRHSQPQGTRRGTSTPPRLAIPEAALPRLTALFVHT